MNAPQDRPVPNSKPKTQNSKLRAARVPVTTPEQAIAIASALLAKEKCTYERCEGAIRTSEVNDPKLVPENAEDLWIVYFEPKKRPGVIRTLPGVIIIEVDPQTGKAEIFPSL